MFWSARTPLPHKEASMDRSVACLPGPQSTSPNSPHPLSRSLWRSDGIGWGICARPGLPGSGWRMKGEREGVPHSSENHSSLLHMGPNGKFRLIEGKARRKLVGLDPDSPGSHSSHRCHTRAWSVAHGPRRTRRPRGGSEADLTPPGLSSLSKPLSPRTSFPKRLRLLPSSHLVVQPQLLQSKPVGPAVLELRGARLKGLRGIDPHQMAHFL